MSSVVVSRDQSECVCQLECPVDVSQRVVLTVELGRSILSRWPTQKQRSQQAKATLINVHLFVFLLIL